MPSILDYEKPIAELEGKIEELRHLQDGGALNIADEVTRAQEKSAARPGNAARAPPRHRHRRATILRPPGASASGTFASGGSLCAVSAPALQCPSPWSPLYPGAFPHALTRQGHVRGREEALGFCRSVVPANTCAVACGDRIPSRAGSLYGRIWPDANFLIGQCCACFSLSGNASTPLTPTCGARMILPRPGKAVPRRSGAQL